MKEMKVISFACPQAIKNWNFVPRGLTWYIHRQGSAEYFLGFEFRESVFFGYWSQLLHFFWDVK